MVDMTKEALAEWLRRAAEAHHQHEAELGHADENWADWYAEYIIRESSMIG